jgi:2-methylisocitrate lyase-like PEP mutase family enzyme
MLCWRRKGALHCLSGRFERRGGASIRGGGKRPRRRGRPLAQREQAIKRHRFGLLSSKLLGRKADSANEARARADRSSVGARAKIALPGWHDAHAGQYPMSTSAYDDRGARFLELHRPGEPLLMPNAWDAGSARLLASLGFEALATTSSGFAATLGRLDYGVTREQALAHGAALVAVVEVPVSADLEDCFGEDADGVAETVRMARAAGLAGCSIEDWDAGTQTLYPLDLAVERVAAAASAAHDDGRPLVLTARAENHLRGVDDTDDTIARLLAYEQAGADVLYAPAFHAPAHLRELLASVQKPVNVLARADTPPVAELASLGVARVSVGGAFAFAALAAARDAALELRERGTYAYTERSAEGGRAARAAFSG